MRYISVVFTDAEVLITNDLSRFETELFLYKDLLKRWGLAQIDQLCINWWGVATIAIYRHPKRMFGFDAICCEWNYCRDIPQYIAFTFDDLQQVPNIRQCENNRRVDRIVRRQLGHRLRSQNHTTGLTLYYRQEAIYVHQIPSAFVVDLAS